MKRMAKAKTRQGKDEHTGKDEGTEACKDKDKYRQ